MGTIRSFEDLIAWQKGMDLTVLIYELTKRFPTEEKYGLVSQMRRAASSVPCNIAEGFGRRTKADYIRFLDMAGGSANELITQLKLTGRLRIVSELQLSQAVDMAKEVQRIIRGLTIALDEGVKATRCQ